MDYPSLTAVVLFLADLSIKVGLSVRVIMRRLSVGVSLAWLTVILIFPFFGAAVYVLIGETNLGRRRAARAAQIHAAYVRWRDDLQDRSTVDWTAVGRDCQPLARLSEISCGIPALPGNRLELLDTADAVFDRLIADIDAARRTVHMEFYIWHPGGRADEVVEAVLRAASRGVICRVLLDTVGSGDFLSGPLRRRMQAGGVHVAAALPVSLLRAVFVRFDLRLHRKIVVIDGQTAYTGSLNLVDPRYFKQGAGVGEWVDAMARIEGPVVEALGLTFIADWEMETGEGVERLAATADIHPVEPRGTSAVQVLPSGPAQRANAIHDVLLATIYAAREELILTTPYFVPEETLLTALTSAARRGVEVTVVVPERVDSRLVRLASQAHKGDLLAAGVRIYNFAEGLLHTKSITMDGRIGLFGSLNLDPRSIWLNFEITLAIYDPEFVRQLRDLQLRYVESSQPLSLDAWRERTGVERMLQNTARLLGPLL